MKSTNNTQTTEAVNEKENAPTWQSQIVEDLSDDAMAAVSGGLTWVTNEEMDIYLKAHPFAAC